MTYNENEPTKTIKKAKKAKSPKNKFGIYCKELRRKLGINMIQAAKQIGVSQPYLTQLENGTEPLTSVALGKCLKGYMPSEEFPPDLRLELMYEMLQIIESINIDLSKITIIHSENLLRLLAELILNETYPPGDWRSLPWLRVNGCVKELEVVTHEMLAIDRIVPKKVLGIENDVRAKLDTYQVDLKSDT